MTPDLCAAISAALALPESADATTRSVAGGDSHAAWQFSCGSERCFVKTNQATAAPAFAAEAAALELLAAAKIVRVPAVLGHGVHADCAWLALEWLDLAPLTHAASALGEQLAALHRISTSTFGASADNWLGATPQHNPAHDNWCSFWLEARLDPQIARLERLAGTAELVTEVRDARALCRERLVEHKPPPALLHGDLWGGNAARDRRDDAPVIFDPASYYGDRETDLAMTCLFGGYPESFYTAYDSVWPRPDGWRQRIALYNVYHALNHVNLFGMGYADLVRRLLRELRRA